MLGYFDTFHLGVFIGPRPDRLDRGPKKGRGEDRGPDWCWHFHWSQVPNHVDTFIDPKFL